MKHGNQFTQKCISILLRKLIFTFCALFHIFSSYFLKKAHAKVNLETTQKYKSEHNRKYTFLRMQTLNEWKSRNFYLHVSVKVEK